MGPTTDNQAEAGRPRLRAVLGVDTAWTCTEPSGVALAVEREDGWRLEAVEASYEHFFSRAKGARSGDARPRGSKPDADALLEAAREISGRRVDLVAIDMPLARHPIAARRCCDNEISKAYGARGAAVHSPSALRPGKVSDDLREAFAALGYGLRVQPPAAGIIEVYPHAALIEFLRAPRRLEYKAGKTSRYWPAQSAADRRTKLNAVWARVVEAMDRRIEGVAKALSPPAANDVGWRLKAYEDKLDAVVCCAVAIACLDGQAKTYGDADAAIWAPADDRD